MVLQIDTVRRALGPLPDFQLANPHLHTALGARCEPPTLPRLHQSDGLDRRDNLLDQHQTA